MVTTWTDLIEEHRAEKGCECTPVVTFRAWYDAAVVEAQHEDECPANRHKLRQC